MAIRRIREENEPVLKKISRKVDKFDERLHTLLDDMKETMYESNGVGLAATQVGVLRRVVVVDVGDGLIELINPEITFSEGECIEYEGCLSFPGKYGIVARPAKVAVRAQDRNGEWQEYEGEDLKARCFCHEIDHLEGIVFIDKAENIVTAEELEEMIREQEVETENEPKLKEAKVKAKEEK